MATRRDMFGKLAVFGSLATLTAATSAKAQALRKRFIKRERPEQSGYSLAVITEGPSKTIWLAGQTGATDSSGKSLAGDFDAQVRQVFANLDACLKAAQAWPREGAPRDPAAWLYAVARRRALDLLRRRVDLGGCRRDEEQKN